VGDRSLLRRDAPGCLGTRVNPVHHFDESAKEVKAFDGGMFVWPVISLRSAEPSDPSSRLITPRDSNN
jgi:hypothetical protein